MRCSRVWLVVGDDRLLLAIQLSLAAFRLLVSSTNERYRPLTDER